MICKYCNTQDEEDFWESNPTLCKQCNKRRYAITKKRYEDTHKEQRRINYKNWYDRNGRILTPKQRALVREYKKKNKKRTNAIAAVGRALKAGKISKPSICERCHRPPEKRLEACQTDFDNPLKVVWYCTPCHKIIHKDLLLLANLNTTNL